jgi:hypothetical protein
MSAEKTYMHPAAGKVTVVYGVSFASGRGERVPLHLYQVGDAIHRLHPSGVPMGRVVMSHAEAVTGWAIEDPIALDGVVVSAREIKAIGA